MDMYNCIKNMNEEQMKNFVYWVYKNGVADGIDGAWDDYCIYSYFGGAMLNMDANDVLPKVYELYA